MMGQRPPPHPLRFGNVSNVGSSTGWTDEKHMLYITSLEESFVNQLYNGEVDSKGLFCQSSEVWHKTSYTGNGCYTKVDQESSIASYVDYDTSTNCLRQERVSNHARAKNSALHLRWHGHSLPRTESSGQNFIDGETEGTGEHRRGCREKRQKQKAGSASSSREAQGRPKQWSM